MTAEEFINWMLRCPSKLEIWHSKGEIVIDLSLGKVGHRQDLQKNILLDGDKPDKSLVEFYLGRLVHNVENRRNLMPCECPGALEESYTKQKKLSDSATRAACDMRTIIRRQGLEWKLTEETKAWIAAHDEVDKERIAEEEASGERDRTREAALAKLSLDERRALGL